MQSNPLPLVDTRTGNPCFCALTYGLMQDASQRAAYQDCSFSALAASVEGLALFCLTRLAERVSVQMTLYAAVPCISSAVPTLQRLGRKHARLALANQCRLLRHKIVLQYRPDVAHFCELFRAKIRDRQFDLTHNVCACVRVRWHDFFPRVLSTSTRRTGVVPCSFTLRV